MLIENVMVENLRKIKNILSMNSVYSLNDELNLNLLKNLKEPKSCNETLFINLHTSWFFLLFFSGPPCTCKQNDHTRPLVMDVRTLLHEGSS